MKRKFGDAGNHVSDNPFLSDPELDFKISAISLILPNVCDNSPLQSSVSVNGEFDCAIKWNKALVW